MIPNFKDIGAIRHVLPLGRYCCSVEEVENRFVDGDETRREIWSAFSEVLKAVKDCIGSVSEVWIGGSFITSEVEPHDIDVVFLISEDAYQSASSSNVAGFVLSVLGRAHPSVDRLHPLVDGYLLIVPPTEFGPVDRHNYTKSRGYWDQFWSKARFADDSDNRWNYPAAGYLEVMVDGY